MTNMLNYYLNQIVISFSVSARLVTRQFWAINLFFARRTRTKRNARL